jgi:putative ATPase
MVHAGEDRLYIARRMVRFAVEDIGLADPKALRIALDAKEAYEFLGTPEGELALAEAVVYMASAPKSNRIYSAYGAVMKDIEEAPFEPVPLQIRNAPTKLMKDVGYGRDYQYAHDFHEATSAMETLPERLRGRKYYRPGAFGMEKEIQKRMDWWDEQKRKIKKTKKS